MSEMKHDSAFQGEMEAQMEEHRAERANAAKVAAEKVAQQKGWPLRLADGTSVMAVAKHYLGQRMVLADAEGNEYGLNSAGSYELVRAAPAAEAAAEPEPEPAAEDTEGGETE